MKSRFRKRKSTTWFTRIPRRFFKFPIIIYSLYIGFGYALTGILHFRVWKEVSFVQTVFSNFGLKVSSPTPLLALLLFIVTGFLSTTLFHILFRKIRYEAGIIELIFWGTILCLILSWIPWLYASSITSTIFLFLFGITGSAGFGFSFRFAKQKYSKKKHPDWWKMLVNATKVCAAIIAILIGAVATSVLLPWRNTRMEGFEILRYALLCAYIVFGMLFFIIMPLLVRSLEKNPVDKVEFDLPGPL